ncbi:MAG: hypothetical protein QW117_03290 [Candidatus Pacearchaeota archaeon]
MAYEFFYEGNNLEPFRSPYSTGYVLPAYQASGITLDARTANQLQELSNKINFGSKVIEVGSISPEVFDSIPKHHLQEMNRLSKLTGVEPTLHGPLVEPSGFTQYGWNEAARKQAEKQILSTIKRAVDLSDKGNVNVTFHSSAMLPQEEVKIKEKGKEELQSFLVVDPTTGQIHQIKREEKFFPEKKGYEGFEKEKELERLNKEQWYRILNSIEYYLHYGEREVKEIDSSVKRILEQSGYDKDRINEIREDLFKAYASGKIDSLPNIPAIQPLKEGASEIFKSLDHSKIFLRDSYNNLRELYNRAYKYADEEDKKKLDSYRKEIEKQIQQGIEDNPEKLIEFSDIIRKGVKILSEIKNPPLFKPLNEFIIDKSAETFGNVAFQSYKEFKDKAPIIAIENPPLGSAISTAEELKALIEKSRKNFIERAKREGMSEEEARKAAEKIIGATWDVGHINMLRKYGYEKEDIIKETEKIKPFVKKIHLSDNFGLEHTELPMGMGNVPIKEILEKLGKEGYEAKKIVEAASWWQHFKTPPITYSLEAFSSPLYSMMMAPYWNQAGGFYSYYAGMGTILPEQHFSIYGSGFTSLPMELGGQVSGKQSRVSGTPVD